MKKKIWIAIGIVGWLLFVGTFGWEAIKARENRAYLRGVSDVNEQAIYLRGVSDTVSQVITQAQQNNEVIINTNNGQLVLVVKPKPEKKVEVE